MFILSVSSLYQKHVRKLLSRTTQSCMYELIGAGCHVSYLFFFLTLNYEVDVVMLLI